MTNHQNHKRIAYFISPHGFGHAARASAVMGAVHETDPNVSFEIFTTVPCWFFEESLRHSFTHHPLMTDIGLLQETPLHADLAGTVERLDRFIPFEQDRIGDLAREIDRLNCGLVVCDIAPMGIAVAREAGVPSLLVENFTWDWIYEAYTATHVGLGPHADYLRRLFSDADYHVQTQPVCIPGKVDLTTLPVSRRARQNRNEVRQRLGIPDGARVVLITMGGVPDDHRSLKSLSLPEDLYLVVPGAAGFFSVCNNRVAFPHRSEFFHPDLVHASDAVVGKVGYSTLAEVYHGGVPFGFIKRANFRESPILTAYIERHMNGLPIEEERFRRGEWLSKLPRLLEMPRIMRSEPNGAVQVAEFVCSLL